MTHDFSATADESEFRPTHRGDCRDGPGVLETPPSLRGNGGIVVAPAGNTERKQLLLIGGLRCQITHSNCQLKVHTYLCLLTITTQHNRVYILKFALLCSCTTTHEAHLHWHKPKSKKPGLFVVPFTLPEKPITFRFFG